MSKRAFIFIFFIISFIFIPSGIQYLKIEKINSYKESHYLNIVNQTETTLKTLIKEKQNTTAMIAMGLAKNVTLLQSLKNPNKQFINLQEYSLELRDTTTFKNVWFQLISKDGYTLQRSWTDYKGDKIADSRKDIRLMLQNPKLSNTISVGKFDLTFKTMTPIYDDSKKFMGIIEVITHFNSIAQKLEQNKIRTLILADKSYKKQITKSFTNKFIQDYYIANYNADSSILTYLETINLDSYIKKAAKTKFIIDKELNSLVSYYKIPNVDNKPMSHFLMFHPLNALTTSKVTEIKYFYNIVMVISFIALITLFYFNYSFQEKELNIKYINFRLLLMTFFLFFAISYIIYFVVQQKYKNDISLYEQNVMDQTLLEYNSILNQNKAIAELIFSREIDTKKIKILVKNKQRNTLYKLLKQSYQELQMKYNIRQLHFHLNDSTSFLRMHRPNKFGDSLKGIRQSVDFVNKEKVPFEGFEEGRIYNGFRYVFPLILDGSHIGSVEISFDIYSLIENYLQTFNVKRVNFLINESIVADKVFQSEKNNYVKSPVKGFYFDKLVLSKLDQVNKSIIPNKKNKSTLEYIAKKIYKGQPFAVHFEDINELVTIIPLINKLNEQVIGSLNVSKDATYIQNRHIEFNQLITTIILVLAFIMIFLYREILTRNILNQELRKNQIILDSQSSFILITNGLQIKASNKSMLEFFGFDTLEKFKTKHECICDYFVGSNEYIKRQMGELNWFEFILKNPQSNRLVQMKDTNGNPHIFYIELNIKNKINETDYIISFIDITSFKTMEQHLIHAEKMASLGTMIGNIAHQWRQPLSIISTAASGMLVQKEFSNLSDEDFKKFINIILLNTEFLSETIDTFRNFIKEDKRVTNQVIQNVLDNTLKILNPTLKNNHIKLINNIQYSPIIYKRMSTGELTQVITNIINNAKDALVQNKIVSPEITIECKLEDNDIVINIEDNGGGVNEDIIDKIFEPYFTTKHQSMGTGLGLYMSHKIVTESLKGKLSVTNTTYGAKFSIHLQQDNIEKELS